MNTGLKKIESILKDLHEKNIYYISYDGYDATIEYLEEVLQAYKDTSEVIKKLTRGNIEKEDRTVDRCFIQKDGNNIIHIKRIGSVRSEIRYINLLADYHLNMNHTEDFKIDADKNLVISLYNLKNNYTEITKEEYIKAKENMDKEKMNLKFKI